MAWSHGAIGATGFAMLALKIIRKTIAHPSNTRKKLAGLQRGGQISKQQQAEPSSSA